MTKLIRKNAPEGATHYRDTLFGIKYYMVLEDDAFVYVIDGWMRTRANTSDMKRLYAPEWLEPAILATFTAITVVMLAAKYFGWI